MSLFDREWASWRDLIPATASSQSVEQFRWAFYCGGLSCMKAMGRALHHQSVADVEDLRRDIERFMEEMSHEA